jgi:hypothetical protein
MLRNGKDGVVVKSTRKCSAILKCAVLETGSHSARPWIRPKMIVLSNCSSKEFAQPVGLLGLKVNM